MAGKWSVIGGGGFVTPTPAPGAGSVTHATGALTADEPVFGNGAGDIKVGTKSGNTNEVMSATGSFTSGNLLTTDSGHNAIDSSISVSAVGGLLTLTQTTAIAAPTIRGSNIISSSSANSLTVTLPSGTVAGDLAICFAAQAWTITLPSGWTVLYNLGTGSQWTQSIFYKVLSSADITAGSVTVTMSNSFDCVLSIITFAGGTGGIREYQLVLNAGTLATDSAVINTDACVYFATQRGGTPTLPTITPGSGTVTSLQSVGTLHAYSRLADQSMPGGVFTCTYNFPGSPTDSWAIQVIVEGAGGTASTSGGSGTVTSVALTMPSDFTVAGSPITGSGTFAVTGGVTKSGIQQEAYTYAADTGSANAYAVTLSPAPTLVAGSEVVFKAANANTTASTLAVNGGSAIAIKKNGNSTALASSDIAANQIITAKYDGTVWQIAVAGSGGGTVTSLTTTGSSGAATLASGVLNIPVYTGGGGGSASITRGAYASLPGSPASGDVYMCTDAPYIFHYDGSSWQAYAFGMPVTIPPTTGSLTWVNQGAATADSSIGMLTLSGASSGTSIHAMVKSAPATPWTWIVGVLYSGQIGNYVHAGMVVRDSGTGKMVTFGPGTAGGVAINLDNWNSATSFSAVVKEVVYEPFSFVFLKIVDDGANLTYSVGTTPWTFRQFSQTSRTAFLANPNQVGFCIDPENFDVILSIFHSSGV